MNKQEHPIYGGLLISDKQELNEFYENSSGKILTFPEGQNLERTLSVILSFVDTINNYLLLKILDREEHTKKFTKIIFEEEMQKKVTLRRVAPTEVGLEVLDDLEQIGGPIFFIKNNKKNFHAKFLFLIKEFGLTVRYPDKFVWVKLNLLDYVLDKSIYFNQEPFDILRKELKKFQVDTW